MVERVAHGLLDDALRLRACQPVLGLTLEFRLANEHREHDGGPDHDVLGADRGRTLGLSHPFGVVLEPAGDYRTQARLVRAALRGRDGVAIGGDKSVSVCEPSDRPFGGAMRALLVRLARKNVGVDEGGTVDGGSEILRQPPREMKGFLGGDAFGALQQLRRARPTDLDATEKICLRARHLEDTLRLEPSVGTENLRIRLESNRRAAAVCDPTQRLKLALRLSALKHLAVEVLATCDLDLQSRGECV